MAREPGAGVGEALTKGEWPILTLAAYRRRGCCSETVAVTDPPHAAKNGSLQLFSMSRVLTIGEYPVLLMDLIATQLHEKASGLLACDVNGSDRMDVGAALRRLNFSVRAAMARTLGERTLGTLAYLWAMDSGVAAWLDRDPQLTPHERIERACNNLIFLRWWHAWLEAEGKARTAQRGLHLDGDLPRVRAARRGDDPPGVGLGEAPPGQAVRVRRRRTLPYPSLAHAPPHSSRAWPAFRRAPVSVQLMACAPFERWSP
jgi:hypothetical protein